MTKDWGDTKEEQEDTKEMKDRGLLWPRKAEKGGKLGRKRLKNNFIILFYSNKFPQDKKKFPSHLED